MLTTPAYKLVVGGKTVDTTHEPQASTVVDLTVELDLEASADRATVVLGQVGGLAPARDDATAVELGYADGGLTQVFTGSVGAVDHGLLVNRVVAYGAGDTLLRTFANTTFESKSAGAIVRDLAGRASVPVARAEDGIAFPAFVVEARRSVLAHMRALADLCGFDLYVDPAGKLVFEKFVNGRIVHVLEFAKHVLSLELLRSRPAAGRVEAWGESPTGSQGDDAWSWLTDDFSGSKSSRGTADPLLLLERSALRTAAAARTAAGAAFTDIARNTVRGTVLTFGRPQVRLGDAIALRALPDAALDGSYQVRSVRHRITKRAGFSTLIGFRAIAP